MVEKDKSGKIKPEEWKNNFGMTKFNFYQLVNLLRLFVTQWTHIRRFAIDSTSNFHVEY